MIVRTCTVNQNCVSSTACSTRIVSPSAARKCAMISVPIPATEETKLPIPSRKMISMSSPMATHPQPMNTAEE